MANGLSGKQIKSLGLLVTGMSGAKAAEAVGVKASTLSHWRNHDSRYITALDRIQQQATRDAMAQMQGSLSEAVTVLQGIMRESKHDSARLRAASLIIEQFAPAIQDQCSHDDLELGNQVDMGMVLRGLGVRHAA